MIPQPVPSGPYHTNMPMVDGRNLHHAATLVCNASSGDAWAAITAALIFAGLLMLFSAYLLVRALRPDLGGELPTPQPRQPAEPPTMPRPPHEAD